MLDRVLDQLDIQCVLILPFCPFQILQTLRRSNAAGLFHSLRCFHPSLRSFNDNTMPRRPPPTSLRLVTGPTPPRHKPKHVLPSIPLPTFYPLRVKESDLQAAAARQTMERRQMMAHRELPTLDIPLPYGSGSCNTSPVSAGSMREEGRGKIIKGPWDHSGCILVDFDVESVLAPLKPVAVSPTAAAEQWA